MILLNYDQQKDWLVVQHNTPERLERKWNKKFLYEEHYHIPTDAFRLTAIGKYLASLYSGEDVVFEVLQVVWENYSLQDIFCKFRAQATFEADFNTHTFHILDKNENSYLEGMIILALHSLWDTEVFNLNGLLSVIIHHDEFIQVMTDDAILSEKIKNGFARLGIEPNTIINP